MFLRAILASIWTRDYAQLDDKQQSVKWKILFNSNAPRIIGYLFIVKLTYNDYILLHKDLIEIYIT